MKPTFQIAVVLISFALPLHAAPLAESTFTEVINDVNVVAATTKATAPAKISELFKAPDLVRTGMSSRTELTAPDQTITRVGANTVFSFEPTGRNIRLEQGCILFHSPAGRGGGTIKTPSASATILGTTIIVIATADGGFKLIVLEGKAKATLSNSEFKNLQAGQMVFVLPGGKAFSAPLDINLTKLVSGSLLVHGFKNPLPSQALIDTAIQNQNKQLAKGHVKDTGIPVDKFIAFKSGGNGLNNLNAGNYQNAAPPPFSARQMANFIVTQNGKPVFFGSPGGRGFVPLNF